MRGMRSRHISLLLSFMLVCLAFSSCAKADDQPKRGQPMEKQGRFNEHKSLVRQPAVSGQFYPASPEELRRMITQFFEQVPTQDISGDLVAIICPHAGYVYSGQVAAHSYTLLKGKEIRTVVLAGPSHRFHLEGASVWPRGRYRTPLGDVAIDEQTAARVTNASANVTFEPRAHFHEHSLEVQVPFLQTVLEDFSIVPILVALIAAVPLLLQVRRTRNENNRDHARNSEKLDRALEGVARLQECSASIREDLKETHRAIEKVDEKVDSLTTQVVLNDHRIHSLEEVS